MNKVFFLILFFTNSLIAFSQGLSNDTIHWIYYRRLAWSDFKGDTIDLPGMSGQALIVVLAKYRKINLFLPTSTSVVTVFDRKNSWTNNVSKTDQTLKYYQVMFDLYEVYARKLRKEFKNTKFGLDPDKVFQDKYNSALTSLNDRNKQYMKETKMGTNMDLINKWDNIIQTELKELTDYK